VSEIVGKYSARAAPIRALAATSCCSACRMSGRRSNTWEGTPDGMSGIASSRIDLPRSIDPGFLPSRTERAFSVCAIRDSIPGIADAAVSYWERACSTFILEMTP